MMKHKFVFALVILSLVLSACSLPTQGVNAPAPGGLQAWFDAPLPGTVFVPPSPVCQFVAHGSSPGGVVAFELTINGQVSSLPSPDTQSSLVTLTRDCGVSDPGDYVVSLRAQDHAGNWSAPANTNFTIMQPDTGTATPTLVGVPTPTETPTLVPVTTGGVTIERISRDFLYIGRTSCGPTDVTILARATAPNPIQVVVLFYRFEYGEGPAGYESIAMNPQGPDLYQATLNPTALLGGVPFENATLQYQVVVQQSNGDLTIRTPVLANIAVQACGPVDSEPAPEISCSDYTAERACISHGCRWVNIPATVPLYECRAP